MLNREINFINYEDYLSQFEQWDEGQKFELIGGDIFLMTGGSPDHDLIKGNAFQLMKDKFPDCYVTTGDANLKAETLSEENGYFPDCMITCDKSGKKDKYYDTPVIIVEVVSPGSEYLDRAKKKTDYLQLPSLKLYLIIDSTKKQINAAFRTSNNSWTEIEIIDNYEFEVDAIPININSDELYTQTDLL